MYIYIIYRNFINIYIYIYIYCHPLTDCFLVSQFFSWARHAGASSWDRNPPNFYARYGI